MKIYTIGRDANCDIYIDDKMISRRHALLKVFPSGKMELVDMSTNGTYINGIKLKTNSPMPLSRKDSVSFAHISTLDWGMVSDPLKWIKWTALGIVAIVLVIVLMIVIGRSCTDNDCYEYSGDNQIENSSKSSISKDNKQKEPDSDFNNSSKSNKEVEAKKENQNKGADWVKKALKKEKVKKDTRKKETETDDKNKKNVEEQPLKTEKAEPESDVSSSYLQ